MVWSKAKDLILLKEIAAEGVMSQRQRSREHGTQWQKFAGNISALGQEVTSRAVRDHYNVMAKKHRARMAREERSTGEDGAELTEPVENLFDIHTEMERLLESENEEKQQRMDQERGQALEMRERAMERLGQTRKRTWQTSESCGKEQRRRRSGDMIKWLQQKVELEKEGKKAKQEEEAKHREMLIVQHDEMTPYTSTRHNNKLTCR